MKPNPGQAEPSNARNLHAYLLAQGCKSDWTVLSADKADRKMGIKRLLGASESFWCHQNIWKWYDCI